MPGNELSSSFEAEFRSTSVSEGLAASVDLVVVGAALAGALLDAVCAKPELAEINNAAKATNVLRKDAGLMTG